MPRFRTLAAVVTLGVVLMLGGRALANHDADVTTDELKCQSAVAGIQGKLVAAASTCSTKCQQGARAAKNPLSDCTSPFGGAMLACINKAVGKALSDEPKKCAKDCPECYAGGDCTADAASRTATTQTQLNAFGPLIYCDDSGSGDGLTAGEGKCMDGISKGLSKMVGALGKCSAKCKAGEHKGTIPVGACDPPATDAATAACLSTVVTKTNAGIDKVCSAVSEVPECQAITTGAAWTTTVTTVLNASYLTTYCGSASAAFID